MLDLEASSGKPFSTSFPLIDAVSKMEQRLSMVNIRCSSNDDSSSISGSSDGRVKMIIVVVMVMVMSSSNDGKRC